MNVPDMPDPGPGAITYYFNNQHSARLLFYHDHALGTTRLNVYAGEVAGYLVTDPIEADLINGTDVTGVNPSHRELLPGLGIPLIIQEKTFVDASTIAAQDPTWNSGSTPPVPHTGDLWMPHVYMPNQNPADPSGMNAFGRWHYGPWFWPPTRDTVQPVPNPYYDPINAPWEPPEAPGVPDVSMPGESFQDTPLVNGVPYPKLTVEPKAYRFRILNNANDRFWNLQLYVADPKVVTKDGRRNTEVRMVAASPTLDLPANWPTDGREGGVPDPRRRGPRWIQIGTEGGFLPAPAVVKQQPITWNGNPTTFNFGNVDQHSLLLGTAERADVIVDFSNFAGKTLIVYNDAPAAFPALDPRYDYYTGNPDLREEGGANTTRAGYGPNTRTIMQIRVKDTKPAKAFDLAKLRGEFASTPGDPGVFARGQNNILVGQSSYDSTYGKTFPTEWPLWGYSRIQDNAMQFTTVEGDTLELPMRPKAIQDEMGEAYDEYGRMSGKLGLELPLTSSLTQNFVLQNYVDPVTEVIEDSMTPMSPVLGDGTQIWKITHNGVDTHTIHFHLYDVQLLNRVGWDGAIRQPDANELGWKDTIRVSPLEDTIVALRATSPKQPFGQPDSIRPLNPAEPIGSLMGFTNIDPTTGQPLAEPTVNVLTDFGWEYVWHCHILSHEEMDMMRPIAFGIRPKAPSNLDVSLALGVMNLTWTDNSINETGFVIERAMDAEFTTDLVTFLVGENATAYGDDTTVPGVTYFYRVHATNVIGDPAEYPLADPDAIGFPTKTFNSVASNVVSLLNDGVSADAFRALGKAIFFDTNLSDPVGQACASCHDPATGFADPDHDAISPGAVPDVFGNRNAPMASYASFIPPFGFSDEIGEYVGGQFWDGRADTLEEQAKGPFLNPLEMHMADDVAVVEAVAASAYAPDFLAAFGPDSLDTADAAAAFDRIAAVIAFYERSDEVNPFTSKHDYAMTLLGPERMMTFTMQERQGMELFNGAAQCWVCHTTPMGGMMDMGGGGMAFLPDQLILFSDYRYSNLGIPKNPDNPFYDLPPDLNPDGADWIDHGLAAVMPGGVAANPELDGLFKTPSLRNVGLTAPYGHNGYFTTLKEIVHFYNTRDVPDSGWPEPEVAVNIDTVTMGDLGLTDAQEDAIVAFLMTLSDGWVPPAP